MQPTRREFLKSSTLIALAPTVPAFLARAAQAAKPEKDGRILVVIQLVTTFTPVRGLRMAAGIVTFLAGAAALAVVAVARPAQQAYDPFALFSSYRSRSHHPRSSRSVYGPGSADGGRPSVRRRRCPRRRS